MLSNMKEKIDLFLSLEYRVWDGDSGREQAIRGQCEKKKTYVIVSTINIFFKNKGLFMTVDYYSNLFLLHSIIEKILPYEWY